MNLRDEIRGAKEEMERDILLHDEFLRAIETTYPNLLKIDCFNITTCIDGAGCWIKFFGSIERYPHLATDVLDALGIDSIRAEKTYNAGRLIFIINRELLNFPDSIPLPRITIDRMKAIQQNCTRYRVIQEKEIEVCGELDTTKYLSVEKVEEET